MTNKLPPKGLSNTNIDNSTISGIVGTLSGYGSRLNVGSDITGNDVWSGTAILLPIPPDVGENMSLVSTSAQDAPGGSGISIVKVHYIDHNGNEQEESVTLNGVTNVAMKATDIRFVQGIHSFQAGTGALISGNGVLAAGNITIFTTGNSANIYNQILVNTNMSLNTARMIPKDKQLWITEFSASGGAAAGGKSADVRLRATMNPDPESTLTPRLFHFLDNILVFNSGLYKNKSPPIKVPPLSIIKCTSYSAAGGPDVQATWRGILVDLV